MKRFLLAMSLFSAVAAIPAAAQTEIFNNPDNRPFWGIRASADVSFPGNYKSKLLSLKMFSPGTGFSVGAIYNLPLVANLYFEPGLNFYFDTYRFSDLVLGNSDESLTESDPPVHKAGFRVPLMFGYHFDIFPNNGGISIFTGPEASLGVSAKVKFKNEELRDELGDLYGRESDMRRFDLAWRVGAGITVGKAWFSVAGSFGMTDLCKLEDISFRENRLYITLGYNFR